MGKQRILWINEERTIFVELWKDTTKNAPLPETVNLAIREDVHATWGPPMPLRREDG